ncbi:glycosyltransferase family 2 protein [Pseudomonadota bacterium]
MENKLSIITLTLNSEKFLEQTITSIENQTYKNIEHIIIDGGSTDDTLHIIEKHKKNSNLWSSEPDNGIADAMNKGLGMATGDYILFLHSDDYLIDPRALERVSRYLNDDIDIYMFQVVLEDQGGQRLSCNKSLGWWTNFKISSCHQGHICSINLFRNIGRFNTRYKIVMDYDFILRAYRAQIKSCAINIPVSVMRLSGISSKNDWQNLKARFLEERHVHFEHCPSVSMWLLYKIYWMFYLPYRKFSYFLSTIVQYCTR